MCDFGYFYLQSNSKDNPIRNSRVSSGGKSMKIMKRVKSSLIDGEGINYVIYTSGCPHRCKGCHNPSTWDHRNGYVIDMGKLKRDIKKDPLVTGITFSGGEPMRQFSEVREMAIWAKENGLTTTLYTGYTMRNRFGVFDRECRRHTTPAFILKKEDLQLFDWIIDGPYIEEKRDISLAFRGSSNQRLLRKGVDY